MEKNEKQIEYQFIAAPLTLFYVCDVYTYSLLLALIQKETYWKSKGKLSDDGYFFMSIEEIGDVIYLDNRNDIRCTIEPLYINGIIDVRCTGVGRGAKNRVANEFKINYDKIKEYDEMSVFDIKEFNIRIEKLKRGTKVSYDKQQLEEASKKVNTESTQDSVQDSIQHSVQDSVQIVSKVVPTTIYNIDNLNKKEKIDNIDKIENKNNLNNIENNIYNNICNNKNEKDEVKEIANADTSIGLADANSFFNNSNKVETEDKIEMNSLIDELFPEIPTEEDNSNEMADANVTNEIADADTSFNFNLNDSLKENNTSNKAFISIKNKKECNPSTFGKSFNTEQINNTDVDNNNPNEVANAENKNNLKMKQQAKEYFKVITNEVNRLNKENSNDVSKLKIYYDVIKTLTIDEIDKKEMLDKCDEYIREVSSKKTVNKADSSTLNEKTTDCSTVEKSSNTEPKNSTGTDVNKEKSSKLQQTSRSMEYNRYFNNIQFALSKRCMGTLLQYEKDFQKKVEYLTNDELIDLRNMIADAKQRVQLAMSA